MCVPALQISKTRTRAQSLLKHRLRYFARWKVWLMPPLMLGSKAFLRKPECSSALTVNIEKLTTTSPVAPVISHLRDDPANTTTGVSYITVVSGYQVDMEMGDSLPSRWVIVNSRVVAIRFKFRAHIYLCNFKQTE